MVSSCSVPGCGNDFGCKENLRMHGFPLSDGILVQKWINAICRENWYPTENSKICGDHFVKDDYTSPSSNRLKRDAVPSCHLPVVIECHHEEEKPVMCILEKALTRDPLEELNIVCPEDIKVEASCSQEITKTALTRDPLQELNIICLEEVEVETSSSQEIIKTRKLHKKTQTEDKGFTSTKEIFLKKKIRNLQKQVQRQTKRITKMSNSMEELQRNANNAMANFNFFEALEGRVTQEMADLLKDEVSCRNNSSQARRFSDNRKQFALTLFHHSPEAYDFMSKYITLPCHRTLRSWVSAKNKNPVEDKNENP